MLGCLGHRLNLTQVRGNTLIVHNITQVLYLPLKEGILAQFGFEAPGPVALNVAVLWWKRLALLIPEKPLHQSLKR